MSPFMRSDREGIALMMVIILMIVAGSITAAASIMSSSSFTMTIQHDRRGMLVSLAEAGIEQGRAMLNGDRTLYPANGFVTLENGAAVADASGAAVPGVRRWLYAGPSGITTGQYGVFGSVVAVVEDANGDRIIRRGEIEQESFARYAYFTDFERDAGGGVIWFGGGDQLNGPVHSNDTIRIHSTGAWFRSSVSTARVIINPGNGTFDETPRVGVQPIPMPTTANLNTLRSFAQVGNSHIVGDDNGASAGQATTRIEFIAIDLDGDGQANGPDEGFMRVYRANSASNAAWVTAHPNWGNRYPLHSLDNCGNLASGSFAPVTGITGNSARTAHLSHATRRCFLGGSDSIFNGFQASDSRGRWLPWTGPVDARLASRPDANYLWPISRALNPNFKGVIFVDGRVAISGWLRGRVTLASPNNIIIADDLRYATDPGAGTCQDILGIFSGQNVVVANNALNAPVRPDTTSLSNWLTYKNPREEFIHGVVLALGSFTAEAHTYGATAAEPCGTTAWGRGCLMLTGGIIQTRRGPVGLASGQGYLKRYSYDQCAASDPPPYFPTTGWFITGRIFEVDPNGFDINALFASLTPAGV
jgi:hypothetical protein